MSAHVLVVEDDPTVAELLDLLLSQAGHRVTVVTDGMQALLALDSGRHDLVVLDVMMPDLDGIAVLRQVERSLQDGEPHPHDVPMVVVTGDAAAAGTCRQVLGASNVFTKPFDPDEVTDRVAHLLATGDPT